MKDGLAGRSELNRSVDRAAGFVLDAIVECLAAGVRELPECHDRLLRSAIRSLERGQENLRILRSEPTWPEEHPKARQLQLL